MHILIESQIKNTRAFPNNRSTSPETANWHVAEQPALLFKEDSKYPDKFQLTLSFSTNESDANKVQPFKPGIYDLSDEAFTVNNNNQLVVNATKLIERKAA